MVFISNYASRVSAVLFFKPSLISGQWLKPRVCFLVMPVNVDECVFMKKCEHGICIAIGMWTESMY